MLTPVSILPYTARPLYTDSPAPHNVSAISPLDPQLFTTIDQHAENLVSGKPDARYNTSDVIAWLEAMVATSTKGLAAARIAAGKNARTPEFRRAEEDILILNGLGTYYAYLFRTALLYSIFEENREPFAAEQSMVFYPKARDAWATMAKRAKIIYAATSATAQHPSVAAIGPTASLQSMRTSTPSTSSYRRGYRAASAWPNLRRKPT